MSKRAAVDFPLAKKIRNVKVEREEQAADMAPSRLSAKTEPPEDTPEDTWGGEFTIGEGVEPTDPCRNSASGDYQSKKSFVDFTSRGQFVQMVENYWEITREDFGADGLYLEGALLIKGGGWSIKPTITPNGIFAADSRMRKVTIYHWDLEGNLVKIFEDEDDMVCVCPLSNREEVLYRSKERVDQQRYIYLIKDLEENVTFTFLCSKKLNPFSVFRGEREILVEDERYLHVFLEGDTEPSITKETDLRILCLDNMGNIFTWRGGMSENKSELVTAKIYLEGVGDEEENLLGPLLTLDGKIVSMRFVEEIQSSFERKVQIVTVTSDGKVCRSESDIKYARG